MDGQNAVEKTAEIKRYLLSLGWEIREDWINGKACEVCELRGRKIIFVNLYATPGEQFEELCRLLPRAPDETKQPGNTPEA